MDLIVKSRLFFWAFVSLVALNLVLVAMLWIEPNRPAPPPGPPEFPVAEDRSFMPDMRVERYLQRELDLTEAQQMDIQRLRVDHGRETMQLMREQGGIQFQLLEHIASGNDEVVDSLSQRYGQLHAELNRATYEHFQRIRELCTDEQKVIFDRIVQRAATRFGPERRGGWSR